MPPLHDSESWSYGLLQADSVSGRLGQLNWQIVYPERRRGALTSMSQVFSSNPKRSVCSGFWYEKFDFCDVARHTPSVVPQKTHRTESSAKNEQGEYATFVDALKTVLSVPHSKLKSKLNASKRVRGKRKASSSRAATSED